LAQALPQWFSGQPRASANTFDVPLFNQRWVRVGLSIFSCAEAEGEGMLVAMTEITELVQLKQRFRWSEYQASVGKLARGVAHELNSPLDGVLRYTHLALEHVAEDSPVREHLLHVKEGLDRMVRSVKAFLEFARQASIPVLRHADMNQLVEDALLLMRHRIRFQQIHLLKQLDDSLPLIQDGGLQHAVVNVLKNALDAMPHGGTLRVATHRSNGVVELEVEDTGGGIPDAVKRRVFEPFFSTKPLHQGSGLGLTIAKEAVERSGGTLTFASHEGSGSIFRIESPAIEKSREASTHGA
jgi:signal transduction histidine kinase